MKLTVLRSLWTNGFDLTSALEDCRSGPFDGIEGPLPAEPSTRRSFRDELDAAGVPFVAEIALGGGYVPAPGASPDAQVEEFRSRAEAAAECSPLLLTTLAGNDAWPLAQAVDFLGRVIEAARRLGLALGVETHRSRPTFSPWSTRDLLTQLPGLRLTCDFSHWCCVCERPVLDEQPDLMKLLAERALHVHARVGYDQGPQVPHPAAPAYTGFLAAHERWWEAIWAARERAGECMTMTPEFGPDGYLQSHPYTRVPAANLDEINRWMAFRLRQRFAHSSHARP